MKGDAWSAFHAPKLLRMYSYLNLSPSFVSSAPCGNSSMATLPSSLSEHTTRLETRRQPLDPQNERPEP